MTRELAGRAMAVRHRPQYVSTRLAPDAPNGGQVLDRIGAKLVTTQNFRIIAWTSEFEDGSRKVNYELLKEIETDIWKRLATSDTLAGARKALLIHTPSSGWLVRLIWQSTSQVNRELISSGSAVSGPRATFQ